MIGLLTEMEFSSEYADRPDVVCEIPIGSWSFLRFIYMSQHRHGNGYFFQSAITIAAPLPLRITG